MLPVAGAPALEQELHVSYGTGVLRPGALQKLALFFKTGQANHQELMCVLRKESMEDNIKCTSKNHTCLSQHVYLVNLLMVSQEIRVESFNASLH